MNKLHKYWLCALLLLLPLGACNDEETAAPNPEPTYDMTGYAKGADVSWLTEMEKAGNKFYTTDGKEMECMKLMRSLGMNSIRLRVWVNPADGWCNKEDLLVKAWRAHNLGMRLLIDFHYSDVWADPGNQTKPAAWKDLSFEALKTAVAEHTKEVLTALKDKGIDVEWVQVGNETRTGMLWEDGKATSSNFKSYAELNNAGYDAVKEVYPDALAIIHIDQGNNNSRYRWLFDGLKKEGGKWDVIGMSLYPESDTDPTIETENWKKLSNDCIANMKDMISRYDTKVMMCEVGMSWDSAESCKALLSDLITQSKAIEDNKCLGLFYWEPQSYGNWKGYSKGAFDNEGKPTVAMEAFK